MAGGSAYNEAIIDRCLAPCDNSPRFSKHPMAIICIGQDFYYTPEVYDVDKDSFGNPLDSLSFEWVYPRGSGGSNLSYSGQYDYNKPFFSGVFLMLICQLLVVFI